jgi:hypothetical protein
MALQSNVIDPSQLFVKNFQISGLKEILRRYDMTFPSNATKAILFATLQGFCMAMFPTLIYPSPESLIITDFSITQISAILTRYGEELQSNEDFGVLSQQLIDYLRTKHPAAGYAPTLFIHPWSFLRVNFSSKASLQELLRARGIEYDNGLKIDELFELLNAWVFDPTKNLVHNPPTIPVDLAVVIAAQATAHAATNRLLQAQATHEASATLANTLDIDQLRLELEAEKRKSAALQTLVDGAAPIPVVDSPSKRQRAALGSGGAVIPIDQSALATGATSIRCSFFDTPQSATGSTPLRAQDTIVESLFSESYRALHPNLASKTATRHLVPCTARDLKVASVVVVIQRGSSDGFMSLYTVTAVSMFYAALKRISFDPAIPASDTPPAEGRVKPNCPMLALSKESIDYFKATYDRLAASGISCDWPSTPSATTPSNASNARSLRFASEPDCGMEIDGVTIVDSTCIPAVSVSSRSAPTAPTVLDIQDSLRDIAGGAGSGPRTIRTAIKDKEVLGVLSADPGRLLAQGNAELYLLLSYCGSSSTADKSTFWSVKRFRTQLQPAHFLLMYSNIMSVDIRTFADVYDVIGDGASRELYELHKGSVVEVSTVKSVDLSIVGSNFSRLRTLLNNFCLVIDHMLCLHVEISAALRRMLNRVLTHLNGISLDPAEVASPLLLLYWAHEFQKHVSVFFDKVKVKLLANKEDVIAHFATFPAALPTDELTRGEADIRVYRALPSSFPLKAVSSNYSPPPSGNLHIVTPASTSVRPAAPPSGQKKGICMFNLCVQTDKYYCKRGAELCGFHHQGPSTAAEHDLVKKWFSKNKAAKLQKRYQQ